MSEKRVVARVSVRDAASGGMRDARVKTSKRTSVVTCCCLLGINSTWDRKDGRARTSARKAPLCTSISCRALGEDHRGVCRRPSAVCLPPASLLASPEGCRLPASCRSPLLSCLPPSIIDPPGVLELDAKVRGGNASRSGGVEARDIMAAYLAAVHDGGSALLQVTLHAPCRLACAALTIRSKTPSLSDCRLAMQRDRTRPWAGRGS
jgi:hypothetical protein